MGYLISFFGDFGDFGRCPLLVSPDWRPCCLSCSASAAAGCSEATSCWSFAGIGWVKSRVELACPYMSVYPIGKYDSYTFMPYLYHMHINLVNPFPWHGVLAKKICICVLNQNPNCFFSIVPLWHTGMAGWHPATGKLPGHRGSKPHANADRGENRGKGQGKVDIYDITYL